MTLNLNDRPWLSASLWTVGISAAVLAWLYLAGGIFLMANHYAFEDATPLTLYQYWAHYGDIDAVRRWLLISAGVALAIMLCPALLLLVPNKRSLFGDARFANTREIRKAGLLGDSGIIVGRYKGRYLMFGGSQHVIMSAPTRSGKGVGIVIPNLLTW
jgi:type IV secretion system protein VirD4